MAVRPPQRLFLYHVTEPKRRWCVAGALDAPLLEREEFRSYGAARDWAESYLKERNGGEVDCHDRSGQRAVTLKVTALADVADTPSTAVRPGFRERPSSLAERRA